MVFTIGRIEWFNWNEHFLLYLSRWMTITNWSRNKELYGRISLFFSTDDRCLLQNYIRGELEEEKLVFKIIGGIVRFDYNSQYWCLEQMSYYTLKTGKDRFFVVQLKVVSPSFKWRRWRKWKRSMQEVRCFRVLDYILLRWNYMCGDQMICW